MSRPKVVVHAVASLDGRLAFSADQPVMYDFERWSAAAGPESEVQDWLRHVHRPQAQLEGSHSFLPGSQEPEPLPPYAGDTGALYADYLPAAVVQAPGRTGWFTAVDGRGRVRGWIKEWEGFEGWHLLVLVSRATPPAYLAYLQSEAIPYLVAGQGPVDLARALEKMARPPGRRLPALHCRRQAEWRSPSGRPGRRDQRRVLPRRHRRLRHPLPL
jgi:2,5-diamino-6-(ribosylamino)-4(3H)-pyrimidinone 5'-phosphate reductase